MWARATWTRSTPRFPKLVLFNRCNSDDGRHDYVTGSTTVGPNVFLEGHTTRANSESGPHHRWAVGTLFDRLVIEGAEGALSAYDRSYLGSGHGWSGAYQVFWNSRAPFMRCEQPPTAHNWNVGSIAPRRSGDCAWTSFGAAVTPASLYRAQLSDRLGAAALSPLAGP